MEWSSIAFEYVGTEIITTETQQSGSNNSLTREYNEKPVSDAELGRLVDQETVELNAVMRNVFLVRTTLRQLDYQPSSLPLIQNWRVRFTNRLLLLGQTNTRAWFKANKDLLTRLRAGIIVTQVENPVVLEAIRTIAPDLHYQPRDATEFLQSVGVSVYPILITSQGALQ